ncbi:GFA family protein [Altererythrobacter sp. KTW20L]|uniref:GFA family protein n=1 Tax=Altererythrobacter sp. KTW20L TaxID=2942210 RepID=UPI0020BED181|nr:GFA family protein [Altererythrobacter sp. KTW20L]MCL6251819.1 GFA family protein [Altererythrobacter sp. KTW20L]
MIAQCQCGALTATIAPGAEGALVMCHCVDCQRRSGSQFGSIAYYPAQAVTLSGEAREFTRPTDNGYSFTNGFCPLCGSSVYARASRTPDRIGVMAGAFANPALGQPLRSVYEQSRHHWIDLPVEMAHFQAGREG